MKDSLLAIFALLEDTSKVRALTFIESCILTEALKGLKDEV